MAHWNYLKYWYNSMKLDCNYQIESEAMNKLLWDQDEDDGHSGCKNQAEVWSDCVTCIEWLTIPAQYSVRLARSQKPPFPRAEVVNPSLSPPAQILLPLLSAVSSRVSIPANFMKISKCGSAHFLILCCVCEAASYNMEIEFCAMIIIASYFTGMQLLKKITNLRCYCHH